MQFDIQSLEAGQAYKLLAGVVVPRPIALVTTLGPQGQVNAAPYSFFNMVGSSPPIVALGIGERAPDHPKDTRANIERTGEFVVNLVDEAAAEAMNICGIDFPPERSELEAAGLTTLPGAAIAVPHLAQCPVHLECRLAQTVEIGQNKIVLGEVVFLHIRDEFVDMSRLHIRAEVMHLIGRMHGGGWYARTTDLFDMPRIPYTQWLQEQDEDHPPTAAR